MIFFSDKNTPERVRWNDAASLLGFTQTHHRGSDWMEGRIDNLEIQVFDLQESTPLLFVEIDDAVSRCLPRFSVQLAGSEGTVFADLEPTLTGDLIFDHHLDTYARVPSQMLDFLHLERRDTILRLYDEVLLVHVTHEGMHAGLELPEEWDPEDLVATVLRSASLTAQVFDHGTPTRGPIESEKQTTPIGS